MYYYYYKQSGIYDFRLFSCIIYAIFCCFCLFFVIYDTYGKVYVTNAYMKYK